jgi:type IV pilus assembly protein PilY1
MGERAPGVFALDVTTPYSFSANNGVLFEFTDNDDPDIGHVIAAPSIANVAVGKNKDGSTVYKYFAMVSGGHPTDDRSRPACVFLLALDKNLTTPWIPKVNYHKICLPSHSMVARDALSGLGLVMDANAAVRYAYAGDRYGRLWRFSFTGNDLTKVTPQLLFEATDSRRQTQAISATPVVAFGPDYGYTVLFGTGSTVAPVNALEHNSFYAVFDSMHDKNLPLTRINLAHRELRVSSATGKTGYKIEGSDFTYGTATEDKSGWYIDYPTHLNVPLLKSDNASFCTERSVAEGIVHFELVYFNTLLPSGTHCDQAGLSASYALNVLTGKTRSNDGITGFQTPRLLLGAPLIITLANTGGDTDAFGRRHFIQHDAVLNFGGVPSHGVGEAVAITTPLTAGRLSWREVQNWEDSQSKASP